jgi:hypothetical protein
MEGFSWASYRGFWEDADAKTVSALNLAAGWMHCNNTTTGLADCLLEKN